RERFLPPSLRDRAYVDEDIPLGGGRVLMEPMIAARLIQLAAPVEGERALLVAAGTGYGAAVLASCGVRVVALEEDRGLAAIAERNLAEMAPGVRLVTGPLSAGWPPEAPYDIILIEGGIARIPGTLAAQLRVDTGRVVTVQHGAGPVAAAVIAEPTPEGLRARPVFDCATPMLPSLRPKPAFMF
ncbi:MAG: protein-L-isoaspartate O-methyltransferase family protein, partial [Acetobacteraceae bacterium]